MRTTSRSLALISGFALLLAGIGQRAVAQVSGLSGTLVVTNKTPATATIIDVATGRIHATLPTGSGPHEVVISRDGATAVVTDYGSQSGGSSLTVIDVANARVARTISLGIYRRPHGIVFLPGDSLVVVTSETNKQLLLVRVGTGEIVKAIPTEQNGSHMVGVTRDGAIGWTGNIGSNTVSEFDLVRGVALRTIPVPAQPEAINVTGDGKEVWVGSNATGKISVIDAASGTLTTAAEGFGWPYRVLFSPDNTLVLMPDLKNEELRFIDRASKKELHRIAFKHGGPQGIVFTPDGKYALMSLSTMGRVAIIDVRNRKQAGHLMAGETPDGVDLYDTRDGAEMIARRAKTKVYTLGAVAMAVVCVFPNTPHAQADRPRARDIGVAPGIFAPGVNNAITDVAGVRVGQTTLIAGGNIRTGITAILPHADNAYKSRVPAALHVGNGFGKFAGSTQLNELGELGNTNPADMYAVCLESRGRNGRVVVGETGNGAGTQYQSGGRRNQRRWTERYSIATDYCGQCARGA